VDTQLLEPNTSVSADPELQPISALLHELPPSEATALATSLFYVLRDRSTTDGMLVYRALDARFPQEVNDEKVRWCIDALRTCKAELKGQAPTKKRYAGWHSKLEDMSEWPSARVIFTTFGSWEDARAAAEGLPKLDPLAKRVTRQAPTSTHTTLLETLAAWKQHMETYGFPARLTLDAYRAWARERRGDPRCTLVLPLTTKPWKKWFGGWGNALKAAGLLPGETELAPRSKQARAWEHVNDETLLALLALVAEEVGGVPYSTTFKRSAAATLAVHPELRLLEAPDATVYSERFGSWAEALQLAGVIDRAAANRRPRAGAAAFSDTYALKCVARAVSRLGPALRTTPYREWRSDELSKRGTKEGRIPSDAWLRNRFGSVQDAGRRALEAFPELCRPAEVK
jgi:hypothetical protein